MRLRNHNRENEKMKNVRSKRCVMVFAAFLLLLSVNLYAKEEGISEKQPKQKPSKNQEFNQVDVNDQLQKIIKGETEALKANPKNATAYYNRGLAYHSLKQYTRAIEDYTWAARLNPKDMRAYNNRGIVYGSQNQYAKSVEDFTRAIALDPDEPTLYRNRGAAYFNLQQYPKAILDYTKLMDLKPNHAAAYNNRGRCFLLIEKYRQACADANKACDLGNCRLLDHLMESKKIDKCE